MPTTNELLLDALIAHQIGLARYSGSVRNAVLTILNSTETELGRLIRESSLTSPTDRRLKNLLDSIRLLRQAAFDEATQTWVDEARALVRREPEFVSEAWRSLAVVQLDVTLPATADLLALISSSPFEGRTLRAWARDLREADLRRINDRVITGLVQGLSSDQIALAVVGTRLQRGTDGVTQITRNQAASLTRTMVNHFSNQAKRMTYEANADIISEELYVATLDGRTTPICRSLDGNRYPVGRGPIPPVHWGCRSVRVGLIDGQVIGDRPMKPVTERQLLREYARGQGISETTSRSSLPYGHKGKFDDFARVRMRQLTGTVPAKTTYQQFLQRQTIEFQDDVLGPTRGLLFRKGDLSLDRFVNRRGDELTLAQLARREAEAFRRAGLNPEDF